MFCKKCGNQISDDAAFCPKCGNQATSTATAHTEEPETMTNDACTSTNAADTSKNKARASEVIYGVCEDLIAKFLSAFVFLHVLGWGLSKLLFSLNDLPYYHEGILSVSAVFAVGLMSLNFNKILDASRVDGPKTPFYKHPKFWLIIAALVAAGIASRILGTDTPKGELRDYVKNKMPIIMVTESKVNSALNDVSGENYTDDMTTYAALKHEIVPNAQKWLESAEGLRIEGERLKAIHNKYINYVTAKLEGLELYLTAIEQQNEYDAYLGVGKIEESSVLVSEYITEINAYCEELGIESNLYLDMPEGYQQLSETSSETGKKDANEELQVPSAQSSVDGTMTKEDAQKVIEAWIEAHPFPGGAFPEYWGSDSEGFVFTIQFDEQYMFRVRAHDAGVVAIKPNTNAAMPAEYWYEAITNGEDPWGAPASGTTDEQSSDTVYYVDNANQGSTIILKPNGICAYLMSYATSSSYFYGYYFSHEASLTLCLSVPEYPDLVQIALSGTEEGMVYYGETIPSLIFTGDVFEWSEKAPDFVRNNPPVYQYQRGYNLALVGADPNLRMRKTPDSNGEIITQVPYGAIVESAEVFNLMEPWTYVYYYTENGSIYEGWVSTEYISPCGSNYIMYG